MSVRLAATMCVVVLFCAQALTGQTAQPTFRAVTRLATFDAVVTDGKGRHVTDLTPADFDVIERGRRQTVRQVVYVHAVRPEGAAPAASGTSVGTNPPATPDIAMPGRPGLASRERTGRVMAFVVDDLRMQFRSTVDVRKMLHRYVDEQIQPGDLVAIIRTAGGAGALQQFTTDRRLLRTAIDHIHWSARVWPYDPFGAWEGSSEGLADRFERDVTLEGSLGALAYAVRGVQASPGRKTVVFVSEGFALASRDPLDNDVLPDVEQVIDAANRGGVVLYGLDPRGLVNPVGAGGAGTFTAQRSAPDPSYLNTMAPPSGFRAVAATFEQHGALEYLSRQTGGFAVLHQNNLGSALSRIVTDTRGYYLIGFDTTTPPGVRADDGEVTIRVKRKDLMVRARRDRFGPADPDAPPPPPPADPLISAALSPFATSALDVRLDARFGHDATDGAFVRALVAIDPAGLTLTEAPGGGREGNLTLVLFALDDDGNVAGQSRETVDIRLDADAYNRAVKQGLRYSVLLPFKKPGGYQIRAAVRDERSQAIGASAQFVEVPPVGKDRVALSGVVLKAESDQGTPQANTFARGSRIEYQGTIYDGRRRDGFLVKATVLRDGKAVYDGPPTPLPAAPSDAPVVAALPIRGTLTLADLSPGPYTLQVTIAPGIDGKQGRALRQWVDFDVR